MITLIRLPSIETLRLATTTVAPPLGLAYVAGALQREGFEVCVVDAVTRAPKTVTRYLRGYAIGERLEDLAAAVDARSRLIGLSVLFTHEWPLAVRLIELLRARLPNATIVVGGEHVSSLPEFCLLTSSADLAVSGEGEETIVEVAKAQTQGVLAATAGTIAGLSHRQNGTVVTNPRRKRRQQIDDIAPPAWDLFDLATYNAMSFVGGVQTGGFSIPILATRGCPYQCTYCSSANMWTPLWIPRAPEAVAAEIEGYAQRYGARNFPFQDLTAIISRPWILKFCDELDRRRLSIAWQLPTGTRSEVIDDTVARRLRETGMVSMAYAPESGSARVRRLVKKKIHAPALFRSIAAAAAHDLGVAAFLVLGFPHDEPRDLRANRRFVRAMAGRGVKDLAIGYYMALPGTQLFQALHARGKIRLDRAYFRHILDAQAFVPSNLYSDHLRRRDLVLTKVQLLLTFYGTRLAMRRKRRGVLGALSDVVRSSLRREHSSKLQSALANGVRSLVRLARSGLSPRWMSHDAETRLLAGWDATYAAIHARREGAFGESRFPVSYDELSRTNVARALRTQHATRIALEAAT